MKKIVSLCVGVCVLSVVIVYLVAFAGYENGTPAYEFPPISVNGVERIEFIESYPDSCTVRVLFALDKFMQDDLATVLALAEKLMQYEELLTGLRVVSIMFDDGFFDKTYHPEAWACGFIGFSCQVCETHESFDFDSHWYYMRAYGRTVHSRNGIRRNGVTQGNY